MSADEIARVLSEMESTSAQCRRFLRENPELAARHERDIVRTYIETVGTLARRAMSMVGMEGVPWQAD